MGHVRDFIRHNYRHFNAAALVDAADAWGQHIHSGGKMLLTMGGAMSTGEMGISVAELIRQDKVHALSVTGANLEEDMFNLVAHNAYQRVPEYRGLSPADEKELYDRGMNRVTDTCIPEDEAMRKVEEPMRALWRKADADGARRFPHEYFYELIRSGVLADQYQIDPKNSWLAAAAEKDLPIVVPGWEDSTFGNFIVARHLQGELSSLDLVKGGLEYMKMFQGWYSETQAHSSIGFFQIGGGISGDFPICVVPMIRQDLEREVQLWGYFCQISEAATSFGSYSGAVPNEKITWGKLDVDTPKFVIESDASIVFPLVAAYVLDM
ncbi:MAG: deoxyhypusine synthase family protein [Myxococcota bacterium]